MQYHQQVSLRVRETTLASNIIVLQRYVGYLINIQNTPIRRWEELFKTAHIDAYIRWVAARHNVRMTTVGKKVIEKLCAIARVQELPQLPALQRYSHSLPTPEPMHDKDHAIPTLEDLEQTGTTLLTRARQPYYTDLHRQHPGLRHALLFQRGLILRLLARHPLRARNIVELQHGTNLYRDDHNVWTLHFRSEDLKISERSGWPNKWRGAWPSDLVQDLEEYLNEHRPKLPRADKTRYLFLGQYGKPYTQGQLTRDLNIDLMQYTGKRFYTHLAEAWS